MGAFPKEFLEEFLQIFQNYFEKDIRKEILQLNPEEISVENPIKMQGSFENILQWFPGKVFRGICGKAQSQNIFRMEYFKEILIIGSRNSVRNYQDKLLKESL